MKQTNYCISVNLAQVPFRKASEPMCSFVLANFKFEGIPVCSYLCLSRELPFWKTLEQRSQGQTPLSNRRLFIITGESRPFCSSAVEIVSELPSTLFSCCQRKKMTFIIMVKLFNAMCQVLIVAALMISTMQSLLLHCRGEPLFKPKLMLTY